MIAVIDYGMGNLRSVSKALEKVGANVYVSSDPQSIQKASAIVLPGVGAFSHAMKELKNLGIPPYLHEAIEGGKPYLGICLGLQLLFTESEEDGLHKGLDIIQGGVKRLLPACRQTGDPIRRDSKDEKDLKSPLTPLYKRGEWGSCRRGDMGIINGGMGGFGLKIPHMGWNQIKIKNKKSKCKILAGIEDLSYFYFVHSYHVIPEDEGVVATTADYGIEFVSSIHKENIFACQFHPEKSQKIGLKLLYNFVKMVNNKTAGIR